jgi:hypothetical protein
MPEKINDDVSVQAKLALSKLDEIHAASDNQLDAREEGLHVLAELDRRSKAAEKGHEIN